MSGTKIKIVDQGFSGFERYFEKSGWSAWNIHHTKNQGKMISNFHIPLINNERPEDFTFILDDIQINPRFIKFDLDNEDNNPYFIIEVVTTVPGHHTFFVCNKELKNKLPKHIMASWELANL